MHASTQLPGKSALLVSALLGGLIFTSCASAPQLSNQVSSGIVADQAAPSAKNLAQKTEVPIPRALPQLIKKAAMTVIVNSVDQSIDAVSQIINKQQGDLIGLKEQQPTKESTRHTALIQIRVPQNLLEPSLDELAKLGTLKSRNITAEDVGDRLVDLQARLTNLQKTEANLQKIMDRSGSIKDVLSVAQELSNVRQSIEQIDAQLKNLQNQVAYSTITLNLEAATSSTSPQRALGEQIQETWNNSTYSLSVFTVRLLKLGIWLMVYSPYILILAAGVYGFTRWRRHAAHLTQTSESANSD
ncbi:DUF4349 domain-containing protein [aff. Roholtiella sp. LEGE 12411]|uniref:DUF4349 domain-containing protein n=1 Tax=aff. Roholtiella sp. LEGE 12411 TaxID=1828822 RepID=UPI00187FEAD7|nr:DUF4349 domain-containing protein [aff. Roholtiella sp. LEGE 12411]MBE9037346.1 DUF4349 domain-containing protein [aff. Roholtiella sp. LEGE 12411]